jgi:hypothetical protein
MEWKRKQNIRLIEHRSAIMNIYLERDARHDRDTGEKHFHYSAKFFFFAFFSFLLDRYQKISNYHHGNGKFTQTE